MSSEYKTLESECKIEVVPWIPRDGMGVHGVHADPVRVTHIPTTISATASGMRSQLKNKQLALEMVHYALLEIGWQIGWAKELRPSHTLPLRS